MATQGVTISTHPTNITTAFSLSAGDQYAIQNRGDLNIYWAELASNQNVSQTLMQTQPAWEIQPGETHYATHPTGEKTVCWTLYGSSVLVY